MENRETLLTNSPYVFIVGMHRSGTSCLTGALEACGLFLGNVSRSNSDNARGNRENMRVRRLNDRILTENLGSWSDPPNAVTVSEKNREAIHWLLLHFQSKGVRGIKDPRILLLADAWLATAKSFRLVGTFRNPLAVASSLLKRNGIAIEQGLRLWSYYNERLLDVYNSHRFPIVEYDLNFYEKYCGRVADIAGWIGLTPNREAIRKFVSADLQNSSPAEIPSEYAKLYRTLKDVSCSFPLQ